MILNKIKYNYNIKLIDDHLNNENYEGVRNIIAKSASNESLYLDLLQYLEQKLYQNKILRKVHDKRIVWINSFDIADTKLVFNFLSFYFSNINLNSATFLNYNEQMQSFLKNPNLSHDGRRVSFEDMIIKSSLCQSDLLFKNEQFLILNSDMAFFETQTNKYFAYPETTSTYFYIIRNPYQLFLKYLDANNNFQEALNKISNFGQDNGGDNGDENPFTTIFNQARQSWSINAQSWTDSNVQSAYNGKIIDYSSLQKSFEETLIEILFHLKQSGLDFEMNYDLIKNYVQSHNVEDDAGVNLSNQEMKMITNSLDKSILSQYNYTF